MWPFKGFKSGGVIKPQPGAEAVSAEQTIADTMREWRQIGEAFTYLGRECVVTGYGHYFMCVGEVAFINELKANYCDNAGVIHNITFSVSEWRALADKQPNT